MQVRSVALSALVALLRRPGVRRNQVAAAILERNDPAVTVELLEQNLADAEGLLRETDLDSLIAATSNEISDWEQRGIHVYACFDSMFPAQLRDIREMPPIVFTRGKVSSDRRAISVVGTRKASTQGITLATRIAEVLGESGVTVVSGLAEGIDTAAHQAALKARARTVAVLGNGVDYYYPKSNIELQDQIAESGLLISEYEPGHRPARWQFLERNAIMSGYSAATIVVEAAEKSGTKTQVHRAIKHGRPVIMLNNVLKSSWAAEIKGQPGVHIAGNQRELRQILEEVLDGGPASNPDSVDVVWRQSPILLNS